MGMRFEDLEAWKRARTLAKETYFLTATGALSKDFRLCSQIQAAAVSVMSNIAEGFERTGFGEKLYFYNIARASAGEVRSLLYVVEDSYSQVAASAADLRSSTIETGKLISGLMASTQRRTAAKNLGIIAILALPIFHLLTSILAA